MKLRRIDPVSCAKVFGLLYAFIGLLMGVFTSFLTVLGSAVASQSGAEFPAVAFAFGGVFAMFVAPIVYGLTGAFVGLIGAALYNLIAGRIGGIELELS
ncbi:MAG: hypothetical protein DRQ55_16840 [Planctomycetota bacterium]|nr:MAG: hypothetical protein DRQ55_16840 [Planctomycetota bacterium]